MPRSQSHVCVRRILQNVIWEPQAMMDDGLQVLTIHSDDDDPGSTISIIEDRARSSNRSFLLRCQVSPGSEGHRLGGRPRPQWPIGHPQTIRPVTPLGFQGLSWLLARPSKLKGRKPKLKTLNFKIYHNVNNSTRCAMLKSIFVSCVVL